MRILTKFSLAVTTIVIAVFIAAIYFFSSALLYRYSQKFIQYAISIADKKGLVLNNVMFSRVGLDSFKSIAWEQFLFNGEISKSATFVEKAWFAVRVDRIILVPENIFDRSFLIKVRGVNATVNLVRVIGEDVTSDTYHISTLPYAKSGSNKLENDELDIRFKTLSFNPKEIIRQLSGFPESLEQFLREGKTTFPIEFHGSVAFAYNNQPIIARVWTKREGKENTIVMDRGDFKNICEIINEDLCEEEINIISQYPMRLSGFVRMRDYARREAEKMHDKRKDFPQKAYRHILWSYLLAKAYGEEFARALTSAHKGSKIDPEEKGLGGVRPPEMVQMDLNNNAVGIRYALSGYTQESIEGRIWDDPEVIFLPGFARGQKPPPELDLGG